MACERMTGRVKVGARIGWLEQPSTKEEEGARRAKRRVLERREGLEKLKEQLSAEVGKVGVCLWDSE